MDIKFTDNSKEVLEAMEVYNCRCTLIAAVDGVDTSDAKRRARTETGKNEVIENMTFKEWIKNKK